ncbi:hypothetical protein C0995_016685 [Termitomyces sp. Mi166|nr:hypothetical protein C0995_016685 [Termitomyces sp. Mi166\
MLSPRSICLVAAAASVALTFASPIQELGVNGVTKLLDTDARPGVLLGRHQAANLHAIVTTSGGVNVVGVETTIYRHDIGHLAEARETLQTLPEIFSSAEDQLTGVQARAISLSKGGEKPVSVETIHPCLDDVHGILVAVLTKIKLLEGKPLSVILDGCTIIELAKLLCTVLTLVVKILSALIDCAGPNSDIIIDIIVKTISVVLCELLTLVLGLVDGILVRLVPLLSEILALLTGCGLGDVLNVLVH